MFSSTTNRNQSNRARWIILGLMLIYAAGYAGLFFYRSNVTVLGSYSMRHLLILTAGALPLLLGGLALFSLYRLGGRKSLFVFLPLSVLVVLGYLVAQQSYYRVTAVKVYHPYLQNTPASTRPVHTDDRTLRVLCLGGSTTGGTEHTYPPLLASILGKRLGRPVRVINAGRPFFTVQDSLIYYELYGRRHRPDAVIVMHAINDLYRSFASPTYTLGNYREDYAHYYGAGIHAAYRRPFEEFCFQELNERWFDTLRSRQVDYPISRYRSRTSYRRNLKLLLQRLNDEDVPVWVVTQPSLYYAGLPIDQQDTLWMQRVAGCETDGWWSRRRPSPGSLAGAMAAFNQTARQVADQLQVPVIDAAPQIPKTRDWFVDDCHHQPRTARRLAELIGEALIEPFQHRDLR